jgi:hypothetical protein
MGNVKVSAKREQYAMYKISAKREQWAMYKM